MTGIEILNEVFFAFWYIYEEYYPLFWSVLIVSGIVLAFVFLTTKR